MRINTNLAALNAWRNLTTNGQNMTKSLEKLSSGFRINKAADDAAGLAVSEKMRAQIRGLNQATRNAQDGVALVQTAEGGAGQVQTMLQRMRELTVQASSGSLQDSDRAQLNTEFQQLYQEIDRTAGSISYNNIKLLNGVASTALTTLSSNDAVGSFAADSTATAGATYQVKVTQIAEAAKQTATGNYTALTGTNLPTDSGYTLKLGGTVVYTAAGGQQVDKAQVAARINSDATLSGTYKATYDSTSGALTVETKAMGAATAVAITEFYADGATVLGAGLGLFAAGGAPGVTTNGKDLAYTVSTNGGAAVAGATTTTNTDAAIAAGVTADFTAAGTSTVTINSSASTAGSGTLSVGVQIGANDGDTLSLSISAMGTSALDITGLSIATSALITSGDVLDKLDTAINSVSTSRAQLGAAQNRLENIVGTLTVQSENLTGAESRIRDVDMAAEMAQFTKHNILSQASQSMMAQANQSTQGILSLLRG